ncbi:MAG: helix-turn-helix transcriptional regulator [Proteobacteria bacterium]|jgi:DNA-binding transcriptional ArsR family regulator|nr:helix-turn-helix transcriptional regulator [Pseudomonadota bacterium]
MNESPEPRFATIATMIGDPTRARMLATLLGREYTTAGEIARASGVTPQTASAHLAKLCDAGLVAVRAQGRHRYFRLADGDVAHALEALALVAERDATVDPTAGKWSRGTYRPLREARSCYGHLAGRLGVALHDTLLERGSLSFASGAAHVTESGHAELLAAGIDSRAIAGGRRGVAYPCVDWSERRDHFAGPLAVAMLDHFVARRWLVRAEGSRALTLTATGRRSLAGWLALGPG